MRQSLDGPEQVRFDDAGLVPAIVQDDDTGDVLMMAWMNADAIRRSLESGQTVFWSRSRRELWHKGATSGNTQDIVGAWIDCDGDTLLWRVRPAGPACHTGERQCFFTALTADLVEQP